MSWLASFSQQVRYGSHRWTVICLHEVPDRLRFAALLDELQRRFRIVPLAEGFRRGRSNGIDGPLLTITLDDADKSVASNCLPELMARSLPACLFVCTGFVEAGWRDVSTGRYPVMDWSDLSRWAEAGLEVGAHTVNHIPLNQATFERGQWEVLESKRILEARLGCPVRHFAYPWGYSTDALERWLESDSSFDTINTTIPRDNFPGARDKRVYRKPAPTDASTRGALREPTLYETVRAAHQRSVLNGLAPVVWRMDQVGDR